MDWFDLLRSFGRHYLQWVLNLEPAAEMPSVVSAEQQQVLQRLQVAQARVTSVVDGRPTARFNFDTEQGLLSFSNDEAEFVPFSDIFREYCGGRRCDLRVEAEVDEFTLALLDLGNEVYVKALYVYRDGSSIAGPELWTARASWRNPARQAAMDALQRDSIYTRLFSESAAPGQEAIGPSTQMLFTSNGRGSSMQRISYADHILEQATALARMRSSSVSEAEFAQAIVDVSQVWRAIATGAQVEIPVLIAFAGPNLQTPIDTPWGLLEPYTEGFDVLDPGLGGPFSGVSSHQDIGRLGFMLRCNQNFQLLKGDFGSPRNREIHARSRQEFQDILVQVSSVFSLATTDRAEPSAASYLWSVGLNPFSGGLDFGAAPAVRPFSSILSFSSDHSDGLHRSIEVVQAAWRDAAMRVALRRLQLALTDRFDPKDALIDAVIGWEAAFGRGSTQELTFRITACMATLVAGQGDRIEMQAELRKIYGMRSKVVHGSEDALGGEIWEASRAASRRLAESIVKLFELRPDLFGSKDLAVQLLLA